MPQRREADTIDVEHIATDSLGNTIAQDFTITLGRHADGRIAEVFIDVPYQQRKFATALLGKDVATLISIALQHGSTVEELQAAMGRGEASRMGKIVEMPHTLIGTVLDALVAEQISQPPRPRGNENGTVLPQTAG
jgi:hypothetical protein